MKQGIKRAAVLFHEDISSGLDQILEQEGWEITHKAKDRSEFRKNVGMSSETYAMGTYFKIDKNGPIESLKDIIAPQIFKGFDYAMIFPSDYYIMDHASCYTSMVNQRRNHLIERLKKEYGKQIEVHRADSLDIGATSKFYF